MVEALDAFPTARFNIDLKVGGVVEPVVAAIRRTRSRSRVLLASFGEARLARAVRLLPGVARSASSERIAAALLGIELGRDRLVARALDGVAALQIPVRQAGLTLVAPKRLAAFRRHVREVHVWTINDVDTMRELLARGIDGIVTDRADLAVPVVQGR